MHVCNGNTHEHASDSGQEFNAFDNWKFLVQRFHLLNERQVSQEDSDGRSETFVAEGAENTNWYILCQVILVFVIFSFDCQDVV